MIYDTLEHINQYEGILPGVMQGLQFLAKTDFSGMEDGRYEIDGDNIYFSLQSYDSRPENKQPEAHREYIDIQYLISGSEMVGVAPLSDMTEEAEAHPDRDVWFYHGPTNELLLTGRRFLVLWPDDAHAPCIAVDGKSIPCRKCVIKVRVRR